MIDIHTHVLPNVDDGSESYQNSLDMLKNACEQGITDLIITPHLRDNYRLTGEQLKAEFNKFCAQVKEDGVDVNLYLGQEVFIEKEFKKLFTDKSVVTINNSSFVLIEFDYEQDFDIAEVVYDLILLNYKPIVAHFERYIYADISVAREIKSLGGYIQINADSLVGKSKKAYFKKVKKLFKEGLVDFVSSDVHAFRENNLKKAFDLVNKKFGAYTAKAVFKENALVMING